MQGLRVGQRDRLLSNKTTEDQPKINIELDERLQLDDLALSESLRCLRFAQSQFRNCGEEV